MANKKWEISHRDTSCFLYKWCRQFRMFNINILPNIGKLMQKMPMIHTFICLFNPTIYVNERNLYIFKMHSILGKVNKFNSISRFCIQMCKCISSYMNQF